MHAVFVSFFVTFVIFVAFTLPVLQFNCRIIYKLFSKKRILKTYNRTVILIYN